MKSVIYLVYISSRSSFAGLNYQRVLRRLQSQQIQKVAYPFSKQP
jgi:predicted DNA binding CopG/RHH family protein